MIIEVNETTVTLAAKIHSAAWKQSHKAFCAESFVKQHTMKRQREYLQAEMAKGKRLYMLERQKPVGIVSVSNDLIENLYVLPNEQGKGFGTELLLFAIAHCEKPPKLWILDNNERAYRLYYKHGFRLTGNKKRLSDTLSEVEMAQTESLSISSKT